MLIQATLAVQSALKRVQQKWKPVLRLDTRQNKHLEQDDDSKMSHPALESVADEPTIEEARDLVAVPLSHHQMVVAVNADAFKPDHIIRHAGLLQVMRDALDPAGEWRCLADHDGDRDALEGRQLMHGRSLQIAPHDVR